MTGEETPQEQPPQISDAALEELVRRIVIEEASRIKIAGTAVAGSFPNWTINCPADDS